MERDFMDLYTLQEALKEGIEGLFPERIWVKAEISAINLKSNGHCYMELSQNVNDTLVSTARAIIWRSRYLELSTFFEEATHSGLQTGMTILVQVQVNYSELYGLSLIINDIDPSVTLGEKERKRQEAILKLQENGLMDRQQRLQMPRLPYFLAIISAPGAAGLGDFLHHLKENEYGFVLEPHLFEATMQGATAPKSIISALDDIEESALGFDAVLVLRGGGSNIDLDCFDDYDLSAALAKCPIPVVTAIGHDKDYHIADMVAYHYVKTPTALADYFLDCYIAEDEMISSYSSRLKMAFVNKLNALSSAVELLEQKIRSADPRSILSRGYVLALDGDGRVLKTAEGRKAGDKVGMMFNDGRLDCTVDKVQDHPD